MKYQTTPRFDAGYRRLGLRERRLFRDAVQAINDACAARGDAPLPTWPASLRIGSLEGHRGIYEMTWSFAGPDGRAPFDLVEINGEIGIRWRRIGGHAIFRNP